VELVLGDMAATEALGRRIAARLSRGAAVLLSGDLGAGKTALARALLRAVCGDPDMEVPSPSYTLVQTYQAGALSIHHFDLWRLAGPDSLLELGWDQALEDAVVVEWPDRLGSLRPNNALEVTLTVLPDGGRLARLAGFAV
jgi:tRNA threonylcarbamoyladenosine biosynthesis protein TsaE